MVLPKRLELFFIRHQHRLEEAKGWGLVLTIVLASTMIGYFAGRMDSRDSHVAELTRIQAASAALLAERQLRVRELTDRLDHLTVRSTEAAITSAEAAQATSKLIDKVNADAALKEKGKKK